MSLPTLRNYRSQLHAGRSGPVFDDTARFFTAGNVCGLPLPLPLSDNLPVKVTAMIRAASCLALAIFVCLALASCDTIGPEERTEPPRALTAQEEQLVEAEGRFGLTLFETISRDEPGANVFLSPLSVSMALGMTLNGARGETRAAMEETLELAGLSQAEINASYRSLIDLLRGLDPGVTFTLANSIWYRQGFAVRQAFIDTSRKYFDAEVAALDFRSPEAPETINGWVSENTQGKIEEIVQDIPRNVVMYLINAIYFKGTWQYQFDEEKTSEAPFTRADGAEVTVDMMTLEEPTLPYYRDEQLTAVELPYGDSLYAMTILLPRRGGSVDSLAARLDADRWGVITGGLRGRELSALEMPRFTLEYKKELNDVLQALGMGIAFDPRWADFGGINEALGDKLYIDEVMHKTFIAVDEAGTEAAAVTSVSIALESAPPAVRIDRPFVFVIREHHSGTILFIGKVADPTA